MDLLDVDLRGEDGEVERRAEEALLVHLHVHLAERQVRLMTNSRKAQSEKLATGGHEIHFFKPFRFQNLVSNPRFPRF